MIEDIREVPQATESSKVDASPGPQTTEKPAKKPRTPPKPPQKDSKPRLTAEDKELVTEGPGAGMTRFQIIEKFGPITGQKILDAAAGRHPPYTQSLDPDKEPPGPPPTRPGQDRGPVRLLPTPLSYKMEPDQFFKYWAMLKPEELDRPVKVYPYRLWPVVDVTKLLSPEELDKIRVKARRPPSKCLEKNWLKEPFDPAHWENELYLRYGAGDYYLMLVDGHPAIKRTVCVTYIKGTMRDMDTYPPAVDPRILVADDPSNESYIRWCYMHNIKVPGREDLNGEDEMAITRNAEALSTIQQMQREQNAQAREREKELKQELKEAKKTEPDTISAATATAQILKDAATAGQTLLLESVKQTNKSTDPLEYHKNVVEMAKTLIPPPQNNGNMESMIKLVMDNNEKREKSQSEANQQVMNLILSNQTSLEKRLEAAEKRAADLQQDILKMMITANKPAESSNPLGVKGPMDMFSEISKMMTGVMGFVDKLADRAPRAGDGGSVWARIADKIVDVAPNVMYNWSLAQQAQASLKGINPGASPQAPSQPGEEEDDRENAAPTEEEIAIQFLEKIETPLVHALTNNASGQEFGAVMMKTFGADTYEFIAGQSDDALFALLRNNQLIWSTVQRMASRFIQFLQEFRRRDEVTAIFHRMNSLSQTQPPPPPPAQPRTATPAPAPAASPAAAPASGNGTPAQVSRRLKPGQRVVHTPTGQRVVDVDATVVPDSVPDSNPVPPAPPVSPDPGTASVATG